MASRHFPPPWIADETEACFVVKDRSGTAVAYVYFEEEPGRRAAANLMTKTKRGASRHWSGRSIEELNCEQTDHCSGCAHLGRGRLDPRGCAAMAARSIAMAMTSQAEKMQVFEALKNKARSWRTVDFYKESDYKQRGDWGAIHDNRRDRR